MTTTLRIAFLWGRYHATAWATHHNEGAVDWPPSPWRILRALYATALTRTSLGRDRTLPVLARLTDPPTYVLPPWAQSHTRHFMPDTSFGRDLALDTFVAVAPGDAIDVTWPVELNDAEREVLETVAAQLAYLGRAESTCSAGLAETSSEGDVCAPADSGSPDEGEVIRLLVPTSPLDVDALTVRTTDLRRSGYLDPPGTSRLPYLRPPVYARPRPPTRHVPCAPTAVRLAVAAPATPSIYSAVALAHVLRRAVMSKYGGSDGRVSHVLSGKDHMGMLTTEHAHAHYLPLDEDGDSLIDHLVVWAPKGFTYKEVRAICDVSVVRGHEHISDFRPVRLAIEAIGRIEDVSPGLVGPARCWESRTPFSPSGHPHANQTWEEFAEQRLRKELEYRGLPKPLRVAIMTGPWLRFRRHRPTERLAEGRRAVGVELEFPESVTGPIVVGGLSHFGLGLFAPAHQRLV